MPGRLPDPLRLPVCEAGGVARPQRVITIPTSVITIPIRVITIPTSLITIPMRPRIHHPDIGDHDPDTGDHDGPLPAFPRLTAPARSATIPLRRPRSPNASRAAVITAGGVIWVRINGILKKQ